MSEWKDVLLGECVKMISGGTPSKSNSDYWNGNIPWISAKDLKKFQLDDAEDHITLSGAQNGTKIAPKGSLLILVRGMTLHNDVPICYLNRDMAFNQDIKAIIPNELIIDTKYLAYWMISSKYYLMGLVECASHGTGRINTDILKSIVIKSPSLQEQKRIADVLSCLDAKIENLRSQNQTLEKIAQTLFNHWFIDFEFPNDSGKPYKSSGGAIVPSELGDIPDGWRVGTFEEFFNLFSGGTPKTSTGEYWNGDVKWLSGKDVTSHHKNFIIETEKTISTNGLNNSAAKLLPRYTTIISARGTVGNYCILSESMAISQTNFGVIAKKEGQIFYGHLLIASLIEKLKAEAYGSVFDTITTSNFRRLQILFADLNTVNNFENCISEIFKKIFLNSKQIQTLTKTRDTLLPKLMSGQIRVAE